MRRTHLDHHRQGSLEPGERHATTESAHAMCCGPAPPILEFDQAGTCFAIGDRQWIRLAGFEPRDYDRFKERLDRGKGGRRRGPGCGRRS